MTELERLKELKKRAETADEREELMANRCSLQSITNVFKEFNSAVLNNIDNLIAVVEVVNEWHQARKSIEDTATEERGIDLYAIEHRAYCRVVDSLAPFGKEVPDDQKP